MLPIGTTTIIVKTCFLEINNKLHIKQVFHYNFLFSGSMPDKNTEVFLCPPGLRKKPFHDGREVALPLATFPRRQLTSGLLELQLCSNSLHAGMGKSALLSILEDMEKIVLNHFDTLCQWWDTVFPRIKATHSKSHDKLLDIGLLSNPPLHLQSNHGWKIFYPT